MPARRLKNELYTALYDLLVLDKLDDTGIYDIDEYSYNEILSECERLHDEYIKLDSVCCNHEPSTLINTVMSSKRPKCDHQRNMVDLFNRTHDEINSKWYGTV